MNPLYLGSGDRRLFALYEPPSVHGQRARAAVLCNPWGSEYVYAHRSLRQLAAKLSLSGFHTLRFDFFGTGDSGGEASEGDVFGWEADTEAAIEAIRDIAGTARVVLVGLRLGAAIAANVAARLPEQVEALVMWDPVVSGEAYVAALRGTVHADLGTGDLGIEVQGFPLTETMIRGLKTIDLRGAIAAPPVRSLVLVTEQPASPESFHGTSASNAGSAVEFLQAPCPWVEAVTITGALPVPVINRVAEWLG